MHIYVANSFFLDYILTILYIAFDTKVEPRVFLHKVLNILLQKMSCYDLQDAFLQPQTVLFLVYREFSAYG